MRFREALIWAALLSSPALAGDGVIEINEAKVAAGGITSCDTPGYPASICDAGSYRLTSNLHFPSATSNAIRVETANVTIDLNGMTVAGDNTCQAGANGWVTSCAETTFTHGIHGSVRTSVRNGTVSGAGGVCIALNQQSVVENVTVHECGNGGVALEGRSRLSNVTALRSRFIGITAFDGTSVHHATVAFNGSAGLSLSSGSTAERVAATGNGYAGVLMSSATLSGFAAYRNGANGVNAETGSLVESGSIRDNGLADPGHCGLWGGGATAYRSLVITAAAAGNPSTVCGGAVNLGGNSCQWGACPP